MAYGEPSGFLVKPRSLYTVTHFRETSVDRLYHGGNKAEALRIGKLAHGETGGHVEVFDCITYRQIWEAGQPPAGEQNGN